MAILDYWHPILRSRELKRKPVAVELAGESIVLFRTEEGTPGALMDSCPHRRMRLSKGWVEGDRLVCPYHGWSYNPQGEGYCPGTPNLAVCVQHFEVIERYGGIWVKAANSNAEFPSLNSHNATLACTLHHRIHAPLELVLDNFSEIEHTATTHELLGYTREQMSVVDVQVELTDSTVRVVNKAPQKPIPEIVARIFSIKNGDLFVDEWVTYFNPVYSVYDYYWEDAIAGDKRSQKLQLAIFFTPINNQETDVFTFAFSIHPPQRAKAFSIVFNAVLKRLVDREIKLDKQAIENLASLDPSIQGMRLGRFDRVLRENRLRIESIYRS